MLTGKPINELSHLHLDRIIQAFMDNNIIDVRFVVFHVLTT